MQITFRPLSSSAFLCLLLSPAAKAEDPLFDSTARAYPTGDQVLSEAYRPNGIAEADFDGDGDIDLALAHVGNYLQPRFCLMRNEGDGTFVATLHQRTSGETTDVVAGDFDLDGDQDLAFCQSDFGISGQKVLVFSNLGNGTFGQEASYSCGKGPTGIVALDVEGDGDLDLATANWLWGEADVSVLRNDGAGHFSVRSDYAIPGQQPYKLAAGDLDGDALPDLVVTVRGGFPALSVMFNDGSGGFESPVQYDSGDVFYFEVPGVAVADVDLDGDLDVLYAQGEEQTGYVSTMALYRNLGNGTLAPFELLATDIGFGGVHEFSVGDVTLDGWPDIVAVSHSSQYGWALVPSIGNGDFGAAQTFRSGELSRAIALADGDGDSDLDVVVANPGSLTVEMHENEAGSFHRPPRFTVDAFSMETDVADLDLDGDLDAVTASSMISILHNDGTGNFSVTSFSPLLSVLDHPKLRDLNGDGYPDLLLLKNTNIGAPPYNFYWALNDGAGDFGPISQQYLGSYGTGDLDTLDAEGDGDLDVVITEYLGGPGDDGRKFYLLRNNGNGTFQAPTTIIDWTITSPYRIRTADVDGDGDEDVVTGHGELMTWLNDGTGNFGPPYAADMGDAGTLFMTIGDFDGDGNVDVAGVGYGSTFRGQAMSVIRGYGDGGFRPPTTYYGMFSLQYGGLAGLEPLDADGDGDTDLAAGAYGADDVAIWINRGDGTFEPQRRYGVDGDPTFVRAGDVDGDGRTDLLANISIGPPLGTAVTLLRNLGEATGALPYCFCASDSPCGNDDSKGGCANSTGSGSTMVGIGSTSVAADDLFLTANSLPLNQFGLFYMGAAQTGFAFGDGMRCVGGGGVGIFRFAVQSSGSSGVATRGPIVGYTRTHFAADGRIAAGQTWNFQFWYRDPTGPCGSAFNLSNAVTATFRP